MLLKPVEFNKVFVEERGERLYFNFIERQSGTHYLYEGTTKYKIAKLNHFCILVLSSGCFSHELQSILKSVRCFCFPLYMLKNNLKFFA